MHAVRSATNAWSRVSKPTLSVVTMCGSVSDRFWISRSKAATQPKLEPALIARWQMMRLLYHRRFLHPFYVRSCQRVDEFHEACLVRITDGGLAIWLHPVGMLEPQVVVNLLPELGEGVNFVKHGSWLVKDPAEWSARVGGASTRQQPSERARQDGTHLSAVWATLG